MRLAMWTCSQYSIVTLGRRSVCDGAVAAFPLFERLEFVFQLTREFVSLIAQLPLFRSVGNGVIEEGLKGMTITMVMRQELLIGLTQISLY